MSDTILVVLTATAVAGLVCAAARIVAIGAGRRATILAPGSVYGLLAGVAAGLAVGTSLLPSMGGLA